MRPDLGIHLNPVFLFSSGGKGNVALAGLLLLLDFLSVRSLASGCHSHEFLLKPNLDDQDQQKKRGNFLTGPPLCGTRNHQNPFPGIPHDHRSMAMIPIHQSTHLLLNMLAP